MSENDIDEVDGLFELDKIQLPESSTRVAGAVQAIDTTDIEPAEPPGKASKTVPKEESRKKTIGVIIVAISITVLATLSYFLWESSIAARSSQHAGDTYQMIGPIITNLDERRRIKISLSVRYNTEIEQASVLRLRIENDILIHLTSPNTKKTLAEYNAEDQKQYLERTITSLVKNDPIDDMIVTLIEIY